MHSNHVRRRSPRNRRPFLEPAIMILLKEKPSYGYKILEDLAEFGMERINASLVYRLLANLERLGWIQSTLEASQKSGPARRTYTLTDEGKGILEHWIRKLEVQREGIDRMIRRGKK